MSREDRRAALKRANEQSREQRQDRPAEGIVDEIVEAMDQETEKTDIGTVKEEKTEETPKKKENSANEDKPSEELPKTTTVKANKTERVSTGSKKSGFKGMVPSMYARAKIRGEMGVMVKLTKEEDEELTKVVASDRKKTKQNYILQALDVFLELKNKYIETLTEEAESREISIGAVLNEMISKYMAEKNDAEPEK